MRQPSPTNSDNFPHISISSDSATLENQNEAGQNVIGSLHNRLSRSYIDSQGSTTSGSPNPSPRGLKISHHHDPLDPSINCNEPNARFPILVQDKIAKLKSKMKAIEEKKDNESTDSPVTEEKEEFETDLHFLKKLPLVADGEEFNMKKTHIHKFKGREDIFNKDLNRCRSLETSFLPLDSVQEDKDEEELNAFKQRRKLEGLTIGDLNEFNQHEKTPEKKTKRRYSLQLPMLQDSIQEEQEHGFIPHFHVGFVYYAGLLSSHHGSMHSSPGPLLKVDEIDFKDKKLKSKEGDEDEEIDPIIEETEEKNKQLVEDNKEYQLAKHKLITEKEFLKKIEKGEMIDQNDSILSKLSTEREYIYIGSDVIQEVNEEDRSVIDS
jgi:hypothetical protein